MFRILRHEARGKSRWVVAAGFLLCAPAFAAAQIHGVPASVSSIGFGGNFGLAPGVPASVTSIGTVGFPPNCCVNPFVPSNPNPQLFHRHHRQDAGLAGEGGVAVYPVPYAVPVPVPYEDQEQGAPPEGQFYAPANAYDRPGQSSPAPIAASAAPASRPDVAATPEPEPVTDQPETLLVFKDGHKIEVENYAIVGDTLFDLTGGRRRKIALAELDISATVQQNDDRGIQFTVPDN